VNRIGVGPRGVRAREVEVRERDPDRDPLQERVDRQDPQDQHELPEVRRLVLPWVDLGIGEHLVGHDHQRDPRDDPGADLERGRERVPADLRQPLVQQAERRRRDHDSRRQPHRITF